MSQITLEETFIPTNGVCFHVMQAGPLVRPDRTLIAAALRAVHAGTLVLAADSPALGSEVVHVLLDTLDCAAVVVREA